MFNEAGHGGLTESHTGFIIAGVSIQLYVFILMSNEAGILRERRMLTISRSISDEMLIGPLNLFISYRCIIFSFWKLFSLHIYL